MSLFLAEDPTASGEWRLSERDVDAALVRARFLGGMSAELRAPTWAHAGHWLPTRYGRACVVETCDGSRVIRIPVAEIERQRGRTTAVARVDAAATHWRAAP
jgi:hypothetical protein